MTKPTFREKLYKIILNLIEDYHIPEGKSTEKCVDQICDLVVKDREYKEKELERWLRILIEDEDLFHEVNFMMHDLFLEQKEIVEGR